MLPDVGYLVTLLALARFFAPEPSSTAPDSPTAALDSESDAADDEVLRPIVFLPRALPLQAAPRDLRNPFDAAQQQRRRDEARMVKTSASTQGGSADLRDPFAAQPRKRQRFDAAPDLRDPFVQPKRSQPKCPDTGGVPIQRPEGAAPGCKQASRRRMVLAHR